MPQEGSCNFLNFYRYINMKRTALFTISGKNYWHFNAIGVGIIFNYHVQSRQVITTCELSGQVVEVKDFYEEGGFDSPEEFRDNCITIYNEMIQDGTTIVLDYMDNPDIFMCGDVAIAYDPKVICN